MVLEESDCGVVSTDNVYTRGFTLHRSILKATQSQHHSAASDQKFNAFYDTVAILQKQLVYSNSVSHLYETPIHSLLLLEVDFDAYENEDFKYEYYLLALEKTRKQADAIADWFSGFKYTDKDEAKKDLENLISKLNSDK